MLRILTSLTRLCIAGLGSRSCLKLEATHILVMVMTMKGLIRVRLCSVTLQSTSSASGEMCSVVLEHIVFKKLFSRQVCDHLNVF